MTEPTPVEPGRTYNFGGTAFIVGLGLEAGFFTSVDSITGATSYGVYFTTKASANYQSTAQLIQDKHWSEWTLEDYGELLAVFTQATSGGFGLVGGLADGQTTTGVQFGLEAEFAIKTPDGGYFRNPGTFISASSTSAIGGGQEGISVFYGPQFGLLPFKLGTSLTATFNLELASFGGVIPGEDPYIAVGTVSSARPPGVFGAIPIGYETNALDVLSAEFQAHSVSPPEIMSYIPADAKSVRVLADAAGLIDSAEYTQEGTTADGDLFSKATVIDTSGSIISSSVTMDGTGAVISTSLLSGLGSWLNSVYIPPQPDFALPGTVVNWTGPALDITRLSSATTEMSRTTVGGFDVNTLEWVGPDQNPLLRVDYTTQPSSAEIFLKTVTEFNWDDGTDWFNRTTTVNGNDEVIEEGTTLKSGATVTRTRDPASDPENPASWQTTVKLAPGVGEIAGGQIGSILGRRSANLSVVTTRLHVLLRQPYWGRYFKMSARLLDRCSTQGPTSSMRSTRWSMTSRSISAMRSAPPASAPSRHS